MSLSWEDTSNVIFVLGLLLGFFESEVISFPGLQFLSRYPIMVATPGKSFLLLLVSPSSRDWYPSP
jgi:hypothetical protein